MGTVANRSIHGLLRFVGGGLVLAQAVAAAQVVRRLAETRGGTVIRDPGRSDEQHGRVSVVVPVLNEQDRLAPCLEGLIDQGPEVTEILVVDGGSSDGTRALVNIIAAGDTRVRWIDASPAPPGWNGKAWGLQVGFDNVAPTCAWLLTVDADVRPRPGLARALVAHAATEHLASLSAATLQELSGRAEGLLHPAMLATLVYRFGSPGGVAGRPADVQANGQCALLRRDVLTRYGGFVAVRTSRCEDVTLARLLVAAGERVGFAETDGLVSARMYASWRDTWRGWTRSLPMRDRFTRWSAPIRLVEATLVQALPLPLVFAGATRRAWGAGLLLNGLLLMVRLGILIGMRRAYPNRPWTYWLSPLVDLAVAGQLWVSLFRQHHTWRGRTLVPEAAPGRQPDAAPAHVVAQSGPTSRQATRVNPTRHHTARHVKEYPSAGRAAAGSLAAGGLR